MRDEFIKRLKSFAWRLGCVMAIAGLSWIAENLSAFELPQWIIMLVGLVTGEATKWLNNHTGMFGRALK